MDQEEGLGVGLERGRRLAGSQGQAARRGPPNPGCWLPASLPPHAGPADRAERLSQSPLRRFRATPACTAPWGLLGCWMGRQWCAGPLASRVGVPGWVGRQVGCGQRLEHLLCVQKARGKNREAQGKAMAGRNRATGPAGKLLWRAWRKGGNAGPRPRFLPHPRSLVAAIATDRPFKRARKGGGRAGGPVVRVAAAVAARRQQRLALRLPAHRVPPVACLRLVYRLKGRRTEARSAHGAQLGQSSSCGTPHQAPAANRLAPWAP